MYRLSNRLEGGAPASDASVLDWCRWLFKWLMDNPDLLSKAFRSQSLSGLFGNSFSHLEDDTTRAEYAVPRLRKLTRLWMLGKPLKALELALGTPSGKLKTCNDARKFVLRIVPELAYLFSLPAQILQQNETNASEPKNISPVLTQLGRCIRLGFDTLEKAALNQQYSSPRLSRTQIHRHFNLIAPYLKPAPVDESWNETFGRVKLAVEAEFANRK